MIDSVLKDDIQPSVGGDETPSQAVGPSSILLIEDSRSICFVLRGRLESSIGAQVTTCATADECRKVLDDRKSHFDVAVVDLNLPGASNGELLDLVVAAGIPAVVFTATFDAAVRETILARGGADYIVKDNDSALDMVQSAVERLISNQSFKLLVAEDGSSARQSLVGVLRRQRFQVVEVKTGREALALLEQHKDISLVLTDHYMPDMDGYELTRRIRRSYKSEELCVIGISSSADRLLSARFLKAGACDFVYRPYVVEELQCRIDLHIQSLSKLRQLRMAAFQDYLTGLYNRRYFYDQGPALIERYRSNDNNCSVAILDIDHFKRINDTYGHSAGDEVLKHVTKRMTRMTQGANALVARVGGEEFGILLPGMGSQEALAFCEALRLDISKGGLVLGSDDVSITVSIGLAEVSGREYFHNYINAADQCLYMAKHAGRNCVYSESQIL
jgi:diguanylate cyclase (GGDEF)-like protein